MGVNIFHALQEKYPNETHDHKTKEQQMPSLLLIFSWLGVTQWVTGTHFVRKKKHFFKSTTDVFKKDLILLVEYGQPGKNIKATNDVIASMRFVLYFYNREDFSGTLDGLVVHIFAKTKDFCQDLQNIAAATKAI